MRNFAPLRPKLTLRGLLEFVGLILLWHLALVSLRNLCVFDVYSAVDGLGMTRANGSLYRNPFGGLAYRMGSQCGGDHWIYGGLYYPAGVMRGASHYVLLSSVVNVQTWVEGSSDGAVAISRDAQFRYIAYSNSDGEYMLVDHGTNGGKER